MSIQYSMADCFKFACLWLSFWTGQSHGKQAYGIVTMLITVIATWCRHMMRLADCLADVLQDNECIDTAS